MGTVKDIQDRINATYDTIIGLEKSIKEMEYELRVERRKVNDKSKI